jgi:hypothetical protein
MSVGEDNIKALMSPSIGRSTAQGSEAAKVYESENETS